MPASLKYQPAPAHPSLHESYSFFSTFPPFGCPSPESWFLLDGFEMPIGSSEVSECGLESLPKPFVLKDSEAAAAVNEAQQRGVCS
jgi:hypothetical protein